MQQSNLTEKQKFWQSHIKAQEQSGLSRQQYCQEQNLDATHMGFYIAHFRKVARERNKKPGFVRIKPVPNANVGIVVKFSSGTLLECPIVPAAISEVIKSLREVH
jgi:hypothetical protein